MKPLRISTQWIQRAAVCSTALALFALVACTTGTEVTTNASAETVECREPRAQACNRRYDPVCATRDTGVRCVTTPCDSTEQVTYANACTACADANVYRYSTGACPN